MSQVVDVARAKPTTLPAYKGRTASRSTAYSVLHVFSYFRPDFTGEGLYLEKLAPLLAASGVRSDVVATRTRPDIGAAYPASLGTPRLFGAGTSTCARSTPVSLSMLVWFAVHARRYDVVHFHALVDRYFLCHAVARLSGCRVVQSATLDDGLGSVVAGYHAPYRWVIRTLCGLIHVSVAISPRLYRDTLAVRPATQVRMIPQGVAIPDLDPAARDAARAHWGFTADDTVLLFVGGLCVRKDVQFLVDNHPGVARDGGKLRLLLVGPELDAEYPAALRRAIAASPYADSIALAGYLDDPSPAYRAADAFVFASRQEGFGNVLLEAMAYGLPVIARRLPGVTDEFIEDGRTGFLFDTAEGYASLVLQLAAAPALRHSVGQAARQSAAHSYDLSVIAGRYAEIYRAAT